MDLVKTQAIEQMIIRVDQLQKELIVNINAIFKKLSIDLVEGQHLRNDYFIAFWIVIWNLFTETLQIAHEETTQSKATANQFRNTLEGLNQRALKTFVPKSDTGITSTVYLEKFRLLIQRTCQMLVVPNDFFPALNKLWKLTMNCICNAPYKLAEAQQQMEVIDISLSVLDPKRSSTLANKLFQRAKKDPMFHKYAVRQNPKQRQEYAFGRAFQTTHSKLQQDKQQQIETMIEDMKQQPIELD